MKIQVTFEKETKRQFRDQCIKRLQTFVSQIKEYKENQDIKKNAKLPNHCQKAKIEEKGIVKLLGERQSSNLSRTVSKFDKAARKNSQDFVCNFVADVKQETAAKKNDRKVFTQYTKQSQPCNESSGFNIDEMKDKVNQILQKFQTNQKIQAKQHQTLQSKLQLTNQKLDYLISTLEASPVTATSSVISIQNERQQINTFEKRFNNLANQYDQIKRKSVLSGSRNQGSKYSNSTLYSPKQSVTFRNI